MKKINYLLALFCVLTFFTGCSSDDEASLAEEASKFYWWDELTLKLNNELVRLEQVKLQTNDLKKAQIELPSILPGEGRTMVDVTLTPDNSGGYTLSGQNQVDGSRKIELEGSLSSVLDLNVTYTNLSKLVGKWKPDNTGGVQLKIIPSSPDATVDMHGIVHKNVVPVTDGTTEAFDGQISGLFSLVFLAVIQLDFEMTESGNLMVSWNPQRMLSGIIQPGATPEGLIKYNVLEKDAFIAVPIEKYLTGIILGGEGGLPSDINIAEVLPLLLQISNGIPLSLDTNGKGNPYISFSRETLLPYLELAVPILQPLVKGIEFPAMAELLLGLSGEGLEGLLGETLRIVRESKEFDFQIHFKK